MKHAVVFLVWAGCGDAAGELSPRGNLDCYGFNSCAIATGSELFADALVDTDGQQGATIDELEVSPPGLIDAMVVSDRSGVEIHALTPGIGHIHAVLIFGESRLRFDSNVRVADIGSSSITPTLYPEALTATPDHLAVFAGSAIELAVTYRDVSGTPMLGHGFENWSTTGGTLVAAFADAPFGDATLFRTLQLADSSVVVTARDAQLAIDVRPAFSTATLGLGTDHVFADGSAIVVSDNAKFDLIAMASDHVLVVGTSPAGPPEIAVDDPTVVTFQVLDQEILATTHARGTTTLHVSYDGVVSTFQLSVP